MIFLLLLLFNGVVWSMEPETESEELYPRYYLFSDHKKTSNEEAYGLRNRLGNMELKATLTHGLNERFSAFLNKGNNTQLLDHTTAQFLYLTLDMLNQPNTIISQANNMRYDHPWYKAMVANPEKVYVFEVWMTSLGTHITKLTITTSAESPGAKLKSYQPQSMHMDLIASILYDAMPSLVRKKVVI